MTDKTQPTAHAEITAPISADLRGMPGLSEQDAGLLEQAASMLEGVQNDERNRGNCSTAEGAGCSADAVRRLAVQLLRSTETAQCLHQGAEPDKHMTIGRALREGLRAEPWISGGPGAAACVGLCAIQLQGWWHTAETAKAYADAFNRGADDMRAALQAAPPAPAAVAVPDDFRGDTATLVRNIIALLELDAEGALVPHGVGGHARGLLSAAASRLAASDQAQGCTRSHPHENMSPMCVLRTEIARLNHAAAIAEAKGDERTDALQDSAYAAGMLSGWNLCVADDHATFSKVRGERMTGAAKVANAARAAAAQAPAAPVARPHHCKARSADGACEECEGHAQAMAEWRAEAAAPAQAQEDALDAAELREIQRAAEQFADCGETDVDYALLMRAAQAGYLECTHFQVMNESALNLDAARAAQGGA